MSRPSKYPVLHRTWGERYADVHAAYTGVGFDPIPSWAEVVHLADLANAEIALGTVAHPITDYRDSPTIMRWNAGVPTHRVDINFPQHWMLMKPIGTWIGRNMQLHQRLRERGSDVNGLSPEQVLFTETYTTYSVRRWEHYGRRIYALDPDTFELLANTELPNMPLKYLVGPHPTFWLQFPPNTYVFDVNVKSRQNVQPVDGVMVSFSDTEPGDHYRQLVMLLGGRSRHSASDDHIVFMMEELTDAPLSTLYKDPERTGLVQGGTEVGILTPRVVLNFCLYLMQEHPAIAPVPPPPRRTFAEIRSPKQRAAALKNEAERRKHESGLGYIYVGKPFAPGQVPLRAPGERRGLNRRVWVPGHWKMQAYGPRWSLRKLIHIEPYMKGPELGDTTTPQVRRVQSARKRED